MYAIAIEDFKFLIFLFTLFLLKTISIIEHQVECEGDDMVEESDGEDETDVSLSLGEIKARRYLKSLPDESGHFECNPDDVALDAAEIKVRRFRMRRGITMDSGAFDNVIPKRMINKAKMRPSAGSIRKLHYVSCSDHRIPNEGEIDLLFKSKEGHKLDWPFQVADVNKALGSVADQVDNRCRVVFDQDDDTGEDLTHIFDKKTKKTMMLRRVGKVWVLDAIVAEDMLSNDGPGFSRPR